RAKSIFDVLKNLEHVVVLFDEIDQLVPDRDNPDFGAIESVLKFMTPSMLVKFNDLRKTERLIFVMATNYVDRIDAAITRKGRFDRQYLVIPFDSAGRETILSKASDDRAKLVALSNAAVLGVWEELRHIADNQPTVNGKTIHVDGSGEFVPAVSSHLKRRLGE